MQRGRSAGRILVMGLALAAGMGCGTDSVEADEATDAEGEQAADGLTISPDRLKAAWPVALATQESFKAYSGDEGWTALVLKHDYKSAAEHIGPRGGLEAARAHAELAALYRQAALLAANALIETYGNTPEPTDPIGTAHLLTVSYAINGDLEKARAASARLGDTEDATQVWHAPWRAWLAGDAVWPPDLSGLPIELPPPTAGLVPVVQGLPHFTLPERGGSTAQRAMGDPAALLALVAWHDAVARTAAGDQANLVEVYRAGYRLPVEAPVAPAGPVPMDLLYASDMLTAGDASFLADARGAGGAGAVDAHKADSLLALVASRARVDGKIDAERAIDIVTQMRDDLVQLASAQTQNAVERHQRIFANIVYVGTLRNLALVADVEGDREVSGLLRINALERSEKEAACSVGMMALGAWDAGNRYPTRAQDILHAQARRFPSLETARYGLDVMALRVSRERTGETPGL